MGNSKLEKYLNENNIDEAKGTKRDIIMQLSVNLPEKILKKESVIENEIKKILKQFEYSDEEAKSIADNITTQFLHMDDPGNIKDAIAKSARRNL